MKKILLFSVMFSFIALTGCKKDSIDQNPNAKAILGKWLMSSYAMKTYTNGEKTESSVETEFPDNNYIEFRSDGTAYDGEDIIPYTVNGNIITTVSGDLTTNSQITTLSRTRLGLTVDESENIDGTTFRYVIEINYKRQ